MAFRPKLIPTLFTIPALIALVGLGTWQLQRMEWKGELIDRLQTRSDASAEALPVGGIDLDEWEFQRVFLTGEFLHEGELHLLNRSLNGNPGLHVLTPFRRSDVPGGKIVLVNRGWVPFDLKDRDTRVEGLTEGEVRVEGIVRFQRPITGLQRVFLPENEQARNIWYSVDTDQMAAQTNVELPSYYILDGNEDVPGLYPVGKQWRLDIRNDHFQYALTWFGLALGLLVIYIVYHRRPPEDAEG